MAALDLPPMGGQNVPSESGRSPVVGQPPRHPTLPQRQTGGEPPDGDPRYKLAYDEAVRAIDHQEVVLDELRSRAGLLLTAASVGVSFLGQAAIRDHGFRDEAVLGSIVFVVIAGLLVLLLFPQGGWHFRFGPANLIRDYVEADDPASLTEMHRDLALHLQANMNLNRSRLDRMWWIFEAACVLLVADIIIWFLALA